MDNLCTYSESVVHRTQKWTIGGSLSFKNVCKPHLPCDQNLRVLVCCGSMSILA